jgi:hypothetical protein
MAARSGPWASWGATSTCGRASGSRSGAGGPSSARYHRAIELINRKLARLFEEARSAGLLEETLVLVTSDHGEAFGEHGLYFHDASVYETNLRVPLLPPAVTDDVVSMRSLSSLMLRAAARSGLEGTLLDPSFRAANPVALAEHFFTPRVARMRPCFRQNLAAAIGRTRKVIVRGPRVEHYDLASDPGEGAPELAPLGSFGVPSAAEGLTSSQGPALAHLRGFQEAFSIAGAPGAS